MNGFDTEELLESGNSTNTVGAGLGLAGFAGASLACSSVSRISLGFMGRVVGRGNLTLGCLGGGGSPTRYSSPGETVRGERVGVVISETEANRALVLSSCSSSASRLGEMISRFARLLELPSIGMTSGDCQEKDDKTP